MTTLAYSISKVKSVSLTMPIINWRKIYFIGAIFTIALVFFSLIYYVFGVNDLTKGAYLIKNYNKEIKSLSSENAKLQTNLAEIGFLGNVQEKAKELSFQKVKDVNYIQINNLEVLSIR